jgi:hypothetical protein
VFANLTSLLLCQIAVKVLTDHDIIANRRVRACGVVCVNLCRALQDILCGSPVCFRVNLVVLHTKFRCVALKCKYDSIIGVATGQSPLLSKRSAFSKLIRWSFLYCSCFFRIKCYDNSVFTFLTRMFFFIFLIFKTFRNISNWFLLYLYHLLKLYHQIDCQSVLHQSSLL